MGALIIFGLIYLYAMLMSGICFHSEHMELADKKKRARLWLVLPFIVVFLPPYYAVRSVVRVFRDAFGS